VNLTFFRPLERNHLIYQELLIADLDLPSTQADAAHPLESTSELVGVDEWTRGVD
jgi:hypothetical protein